MTEQHTSNDRPMMNRPRVRRRTWRQAAFGASALVTVAVTLGVSSPAFAAEASPSSATSQVVEMEGSQASSAQPAEAPAVNRASADSATASVAGLGLLNEQQRDELVIAYVSDAAASTPGETTALAYNSSFSDDRIEVLSV